MKLLSPKIEKKKSTDSRGRRAWRRVFLTLIATVLLTLSGFHIFSLIITENESLAVPENAVAGVVTPIQEGFSSVVDSIAAYLRRLKLRSTLELEYNRVKQENEQLIYQAMFAEELQHQLSAYQTLYDEISLNESLNPLVATVIGRESGNYFSSFTINKGSNDGIAEFMAVTMGGSFVGYTYNVSPTKSDVRCIIDSEASIAALISSNRDHGIVRGTLGIDGQAMCRMFYLPADHLPRPGDTVVTSGVSLPFPKGIPIGTVRESTRGMESNKQFVVVEPLADFQHIEYVIVLRYQPVAEAVADRSSDHLDLGFAPLSTPIPIPTIQIGNDFYQLAPTPVPSILPVVDFPEGAGLLATPQPGILPPSGEYEYRPPTGVTVDSAYQ